MIPGYVPPIGEKDPDKISRAVRNLYENIPGLLTDIENDIDALEAEVAALASSEYIPDGFTRAAIQAAVDEAAAAGGGIVKLLDGDYLSDGTPVIIDEDNIWITGSADTRVLAPNDATVVDGVIKVGIPAALGTDTTLASNAAFGDLSLVVTSAAALAQDDYIQIAVTQASTGNSYFMMTRIVSLSGTTVNLQDALAFSMLTADTSTSIRKIPVTKNNRVTNIKFVGNSNSGAGTHLLAVYQTVDCTVDGCSFEDHNPGAGVLFNRGYKNQVGYLYARNCGSVLYADLYIARQTHAHVSSLRSEDASGFGPQLETSVYCRIDSVSDTHSGHVGGGRGSKYAGLRCCTIGSVISTNADSTGVGITSGTADCLFDSIISIGNRGGSGGNDIGLWFSGNSNSRNTINSVIAFNNADADIAFNTTDSYNKILNIPVPNLVGVVITDAGVGNMVGSANYPAFLIGGFALNVNANSVADTAIPIISGSPEYRISSITIQNVGTTASLTTAQFGIFSGAGGTGSTISAAGQSLAALTSNALNTNAAVINVAPATSPTAIWNVNPLYFRITQAQGAAASVNVYIVVQPVPQ